MRLPCLPAHRPRGGTSHPPAADRGGDRSQGRQVLPHRDRRRGLPLRTPPGRTPTGCRTGRAVRRAHQRTGGAAARTRSRAVLYRSLSRVERAFRSLKSVELQVRPIHHRLERRVRTHLFLCMLAYYLEWHLRRAPAPLLYEDEQRNGSSAGHPLDPAVPSPSAKAKRSRRNRRGEPPPQSMPTLLAHLATRCRLRCTLGSERDAVPVTRLAEPTSLQKRTLELAQNYVSE